jgi:hypothetical protein
LDVVRAHWNVAVSGPPEAGTAYHWAEPSFGQSPEDQTRVPLSEVMVSTADLAPRSIRQAAPPVLVTSSVNVGHCEEL